MVEYGMTPTQALRSATIMAAQLLDAEDRLGTIAPGRIADLVAVDRDPLADITAFEAVHTVIAAGRVVKAP